MAYDQFYIDSNYSATFVSNVDPNWGDASQYTWNELYASAPEDLCGFYLDRHSATPQACIVGVGAAGAEQIVFQGPTHASADTGSGLFCPVFISSGSRVAVAFFDLDWSITFVPAADFPNLRQFAIMEAGPYDWPGRGATRLNITTSATADTWTPWTEMSITGDSIMNGDSLPRAYDYFGVTGSISRQADNVSVEIEFAIGAAGSEVSFFGPFERRIRPYDHLDHLRIWVPWSEPIGTRISVRVKTSVASKTVSLRYFGLVE